MLALGVGGGGPEAHRRTASWEEIPQGAPGGLGDHGPDFSDVALGPPSGFEVAGGCTGCAPSTGSVPCPWDAERSSGLPAAGVAARSGRGRGRSQVGLCDQPLWPGPALCQPEVIFQLTGLAGIRGTLGVWESIPGRKGPPLCPPLARGLAPRGRIQFHIKTPGCDPSAPLKNPRWRLLEAPVGSALAASLSSPTQPCPTNPQAP